ncbi:MAG: hypothetical protein V9G29_05110 [Burkholderiaceae bacterium]
MIRRLDPRDRHRRRQPPQGSAGPSRDGSPRPSVHVRSTSPSADIEHDNDGDLIVLDRTDQTTADGIYNLWFEHGGWAQLSTDVRRSRADPRRAKDHGHSTWPRAEGR